MSTEALPNEVVGPPEAVVLEAIDGPGAGASARLDAGTLFIGSDPSCGLRVEDPAVSRRHATAQLLSMGLRVIDLQSRNGTTFLGARINEAMVPVGGSITVGRTTIRIRLAAAAALPLSEREVLGGLFGRTDAMRRVFTVLERLAPLDGTVLVRGETGTGKTTAARALHALGPRATEPFVVFECAAVNPNLLESALFGHAAGAFTGADSARAGAVEAAGRGTLLLDEVGELTPELQPKLLRLLDQGELKRLGETLVRTAQCRFIATSARDLHADSGSGRFRSDLYYRLAGAEVLMPPLRERREDIPHLALRFAARAGVKNVTLSAVTIAELMGDPWPGNVRELENAIERAITLGEVGSAAVARPPPSFKEAREKLLFDFERDYLAALLESHRGNVSAAARESGLSRSQFYRLLEKHGLSSG